MKIILTTPQKEKVIAENYKPDDLPPASILRDWLDLSFSRMDMPTLTAKLKSGQAVMLEGGITLEWRDEDGT